MKDFFWCRNTKSKESHLVDLESVIRVKLKGTEAIFYLNDGTQFNVDDTYFLILANYDEIEKQWLTDKVTEENIEPVNI